MGAALLGQQKFAEAEPFLVQAYKGMKEREPTIPKVELPRLKVAADRVVKLYEDWGKPDQAAEWHKKISQSDTASKP